MIAAARIGRIGGGGRGRRWISLRRLGFVDLAGGAHAALFGDARVLPASREAQSGDQEYSFHFQTISNEHD
jgi:hypothetical protein